MLGTWEISLVQAVQLASFPALDILMQAVSFLGNPLFWFLIAAMMLWNDRENESFFLMNIVVFSAATVGVLKALIAWERPAAFGIRAIAADTYSQYSMPSGHATLAAAVYTDLKKFAARKWKIIFALLVLLIAFSRIYLGAHFLSDVIAGLALGAVIGICNSKLRSKLENSHLRITKLEEEVAFVAVVLTALAVFAFLEPPQLVAAVLGFYAGFFLLKEQGTKVRSTGIGGATKPKIAKIFCGLLGIGLLYFVSGLAAGVLAFAGLAVLFLLGFWVSFLLPMLWKRTRIAYK